MKTGDSSNIGYFSRPMGIYPRTLFVVKGNDKWKTVEKNFVARDGKPLILARSENFGSCTYSVVEKNSERYGFLVVLQRVRQDSDFAHEAVHVAFETFRDIGGAADEDNQEPFAYLVGWTARTLYEVFHYNSKNKSKKAVLSRRPNSKSHG